MKALIPLTTKERRQLFKTAAQTPLAIQSLLKNLGNHCMQKRLIGGFSLHEHVWHLADLEIHANSHRITRLLSSKDPVFEDFDGRATAKARDYHSLCWQQGLRMFSDARLDNLWLLSGVKAGQWMRTGILEGRGTVSLADVFRSICAHDCEHITKIQLLGAEHLVQKSGVAA